MNFDVFVPTRILSGVECVKENRARLVLGKKAYLVTGKSGAKKSGALDDVISVLNEAGVEYLHFDGCCENPKLLDCYGAGKQAAAFGADHIIGIGGGSALDSAKAVAVFAANPSIEAEDVFELSKRPNPALPLVAIPTTSGTGSEANSYAVMSMPDGLHKKTIKGEDCWPRVAFLDPTYTYSLGAYYTVSCALDAFAHSMESYLSSNSTDFSHLCAIYAAEIILDILKREQTEFGNEDRARLQNAATAAGIAISVTGTGFPHPMGYGITMMDGVPHGAACAVFYGAYIGYNMRDPIGRERIEAFCKAIHTTPRELSALLPRLSGVRLSFTEEEIQTRVGLIAGAKNYVNSPYVINDEEKTDIYRELFFHG